MPNIQKIRRLISDFDPKLLPPTITGIAIQEKRPRWSVMIPTYNCAQYLKQTLESVLSQNISEELMQIEVIDNCSTIGNPEEVVESVGKGRVRFHRNEANCGAINNFNKCIERSRGEWVHILHGDDWVAPDFYKAVESFSSFYPAVDAIFTRTFIVNESGEIDSLNARTKQLETPKAGIENYFYYNPILTPSVVVRRKFYERHGAFDPRLGHVADWEMWSRIARFGSIVCMNKPLAYYRFFDANDTGRLAQSAENILDCLRIASIFVELYPEYNLDHYLRILVKLACKQKQKFANLGNRAGFTANQKVCRKLGLLNRIKAEFPYLLAAKVKSMIGA